MILTTRGDYGMVRRPRRRYCECVVRRVDGAGGLAGPLRHHCRPRLRMAAVPVGQTPDRRHQPAQRGDVHGAQRHGLAPGRTGGEELRPEAGLRDQVRVRDAADRAPLRERGCRQLRRHRPAETARRDPVPRADTGVAHGVGFGVATASNSASPSARASRAPSRSTTGRIRPGRERRSKSGTSSAHRRCWTGRRCIRSSGSNC